jgi:hypothetical protein
MSVGICRWKLQISLGIVLSEAVNRRGLQEGGVKCLAQKRPELRISAQV